MGAWKKKPNRILESPFTSKIVKGFFVAEKNFFHFYNGLIIKNERRNEYE